MIIIPTPASLPISTANAPTEAINQQNQQQQRVAASQGADGSNNLQNNPKKPKEELEEARLRRLEEERKKRKKKQQHDANNANDSEESDEALDSESEKTRTQGVAQSLKSPGDTTTATDQPLEIPAALAAYRFKAWANHNPHKAPPLTLDSDGKPNLTAAMKLLRSYLRNSS